MEDGGRVRNPDLDLLSLGPRGAPVTGRNGAPHSTALCGEADQDNWNARHSALCVMLLDLSNDPEMSGEPRRSLRHSNDQQDARRRGSAAPYPC
jgi:hypothetical protein